MGLGNILAVCTEEYVSCKWHRFGVAWGVTQVIAIFQVKTSEEWMMDVRWYYRYGEVDEDTQSLLIGFSKSNGLLEKKRSFALSN
jgi:hypothetical protein